MFVLIAILAIIRTVINQYKNLLKSMNGTFYALKIKKFS